jgi:hypothetical protein
LLRACEASVLSAAPALIGSRADGVTKQRFESLAGPLVPSPGIRGGRLAPELGGLDPFTGRLEIRDAIEDRPIQRGELLGRRAGLHRRSRWATMVPVGIAHRSRQTADERVSLARDAERGQSPL